MGPRCHLSPPPEPTFGPLVLLILSDYPRARPKGDGEMAQAAASPRRRVGITRRN